MHTGGWLCLSLLCLIVASSEDVYRQPEISATLFKSIEFPGPISSVDAFNFTQGDHMLRMISTTVLPEEYTAQCKEEDTSVNIYLWNPQLAGFQPDPIQEIQGIGFLFTHFLQIPDNVGTLRPYLIIASECEGESWVYAWGGRGFEPLQQLDGVYKPSSMASTDYNTVGDEVPTLLCISNMEEGKNSTVLEWDRTEHQFLWLAGIPTNQSTSCEFLTLRNELNATEHTHLYAGFVSGNAVELYLFDSLEHYLVPTLFRTMHFHDRPLQIESVSLYEESYLFVNNTAAPPREVNVPDYLAVVVNSTNPSSVNSTSNSTSSFGRCVIFQWNRFKQTYIPHQNISLTAAEPYTSQLGYIKFFTVQNAFNYLVLLDSGLNSTQSTVYSWNGAKFDSPELIATNISQTTHLRQTDYLFLPTPVQDASLAVETQFNGLVMANSASSVSPAYRLNGTCLETCSVHGTCDAHAFRCVCNGKYTGVDCSLLQCPSDCSSNGYCNTTTGQCKCFYGWEGEACQVQAGLISLNALSAINRSIELGTSLINLEVPFSSNSERVDEGTPLDYWFLVKHDLLLWQDWEDLTAFSFGLLYLSVDMDQVTFTRNFSSSLLPEQISEVGGKLTEILKEQEVETAYKVCYLSQNYADDPEILCCQNSQWQYIPTCDVPLSQSRVYTVVNSAVTLAIYMALCVMVLVIFASSKPFILPAPVLYADDSIPFQLKWISEKVSFLVFFPTKVAICCGIVFIEFFVVSFWIKTQDAPGVYGYYENFLGPVSSQTSVIIITATLGFISVGGFVLWFALTWWGVRHRLRHKRVDQDFILYLIDGCDADFDNATIPLRPESDSIIHPLLYDFSRNLCNLVSRKATIHHRFFTNLFTFTTMWSAYTFLWILPCFLVFLLLVGESWLNWTIFMISLLVFTAYLITHWRACDLRRDRRFVRQWAVALMPENKEAVPYIFLTIFFLTWLCGLVATIITMLTIVRNISLVILAISINTYSYTIVAFALGFVILVNAELTRAYFPFQLAKEAILAWGENFSTRRYHEVLRYLNVHLTRRLIEALVKATLLTGILVSAFVAISSVSESYLTDSLLILFTTLIPVISGMMTYVRQLSDLERGAFKGAVLKSLPHPELWDKSLSPQGTNIQEASYHRVDEGFEDDDTGLHYRA